jgi:hypothetical protein
MYCLHATHAAMGMPLVHVVTQTRHRGWEYMLWDEAKGEELLRSRYPWFLPTWAKYRSVPVLLSGGRGRGGGSMWDGHATPTHVPTRNGVGLSLDPCCRPSQWQSGRRRDVLGPGPEAGCVALQARSVAQLPRTH